MTQSEYNMEITFLTWFVPSTLFTTVALFTLGENFVGVFFFNTFMVLSILTLIISIADYLVDRKQFVKENGGIKVSLDLLLALTVLFLLVSIILIIHVNLKNEKKKTAQRKKNEKKSRSRIGTKR